MHRYFESRFHRALAWYALVPVLVMTVLGTALMLTSWQYSVVRVSDTSRELAATVLTEVSQEFLWYSAEEAEFFGQEGDFDSWGKVPAKRAEAYGRLYKDTGHRKIDFYLLDTEGRLVLGSRAYLPDCLLHVGQGWGISARLQDLPGLPRQEFLQGDTGTGQDLVCGQAVEHKGRVTGFLFFVLPGEYLSQLAGDGQADIFLVDELDNARLLRGSEQLTDFRKLRGEFLDQENGLVFLEKNIYYETSKPVNFADGRYRVYVIANVSDLFVRYAIGAGALLLAVLLMIPLLLRSIARESRLTAQAVDNLTAIAELKELESQFNPHFLFNTLENIKFMVRLDPAAAVEMIMALSALLRYSIGSGGRQAEFREDLKYLESYMKIQQYRFGSRLDFQRYIDPRAMDFAIPKLLFQPLLENAIKYGEDEEGKLAISFKVSVTDNQLMILVKDKGRGMEAGKLQELLELLQSQSNETDHRGLFNVQRRVQLLYGEEYGLQIACPPEGGTEISLRLPGVLKKKDEVEEDG